MKKLYQDPRFRVIGEKRRNKWLKRQELKESHKEGAHYRIVGKYVTSNILDYLKFRMSGTAIPKKVGHSLIIKIPKVFSFILNPAEAVSTLSMFLYASSFTDYRKLIIDHSECETLDLCASVMLDILVMELMKEWRARKAGKMIGGYYSKSGKVNALLRCTGLVHHLKVRGQEPPVHIDSNFVKFPLRAGYKPQSRDLKSTAQERAADDLAKHFNESLKAFGYSLSDDGQAYIIQVAGEVIDNAERHSGRGKWWTMGYMNRNENFDIGECELTIICLGNTIYESLNKNAIASQLRDALESLTQTHQKKKTFELSPRFTVETLWTLYALQDGVSRFAYSKPGSGSGTIKMIEAFQRLGSSLDKAKKPLMTVLSGSSRLLFDGTYHMAKVTRGGESRQIIAFNKSNDLDQRPDDDYVHSYGEFFPGTIMSLRFFLDRSYLDTIHT